MVTKRTPIMKKNPSCEACGKEIKSNYHGEHVELFPGRKVWLCTGREYVRPSIDSPSYTTVRVSKTCLTKVRETLALCPACGEAEHCAPGTICKDCRLAVVRGRAATPEPLQIISLNTSQIFPYVSPSYASKHRDIPSERLQEAAHLLGLAIAAHLHSDRNMIRDGGSYRSIGGHNHDGLAGDPKIEVTVQQRIALERYLAKLRVVADLIYLDGRQDGRNLLAQLAAGTMTTREIEESDDRADRELQRLLNKLARDGSWLDGLDEDIRKERGEDEEDDDG